jgi:hypothetical protein
MWLPCRAPAVTSWHRPRKATSVGLGGGQGSRSAGKQCFMNRLWGGQTELQCIQPFQPTYLPTYLYPRLPTNQ